MSSLNENTILCTKLETGREKRNNEEMDWKRLEAKLRISESQKWKEPNWHFSCEPRKFKHF